MRFTPVSRVQPPARSRPSTSTGESLSKMTPAPAPSSGEPKAATVSMRTVGMTISLAGTAIT